MGRERQEVYTGPLQTVPPSEDNWSSDLKNKSATKGIENTFNGTYVSQELLAISSM